MSRITVWDIGLVALIVFTGVCLLSFGRSSSRSGFHVVIKDLRGRTLSFRLTEDGEVTIDGLMGETTIAIDQGSVRFLSSACPHGLCVKKGKISRSGEWIACLPNGIVAQISGQVAYDGITP